MLTLNITIKDSYVVATYSGMNESTTIWSTLQTLKKALDKNQLLNVLIDWNAVEPAPTDMVRYIAGQALSEMLPPPYHVAILCHDIKKRNYIGNVARNRGVDIFHSDNLNEIKRWLSLDSCEKKLVLEKLDA